MAKPAQNSDKKISRKETIRAQRLAQQRRTRLIWIGIATIAAIAIAAMLIVPTLPVSPENIKAPAPRERTNIEGNSVGDPNAPVKVIEYSDFNCIHCRNFWDDAENTLYERYVATGKVQFSYVPMSFISPTSSTAAEAAYCAMDQGKFWEYHDYLFANFGADFTSPMLKAIAQEVGLDMNAYNDCANSNKYRVKVQQDLQSAQSQGINSTPTFVVNGEITDSNNLFAVIEKHLSDK